MLTSIAKEGTVVLENSILFTGLVIALVDAFTVGVVSAALPPS